VNGDQETIGERLDRLQEQQVQHEKKYSDSTPSLTPAPPAAEPIVTRARFLWTRYSGYAGAAVVIGAVALFIIGTLADEASNEPYEPLQQGTLVALTDPLPQGIPQQIIATRCSTDSGLEQISISSSYQMVALPDGSEPPLDEDGNPPYLAVTDDFRVEFEGRTNGTDAFCDHRNFTPSNGERMTAGFWVYTEHYFATVPGSDQVIHAETDTFEVTN